MGRSAREIIVQIGLETQIERWGCARDYTVTQEDEGTRKSGNGGEVYEADEKELLQRAAVGGEQGEKVERVSDKGERTEEWRTLVDAEGEGQGKV